jgi:hypothetical protein
MRAARIDVRSFINATRHLLRRKIASAEERVADYPTKRSVEPTKGG